MFCRKCGKQIDYDAPICKECEEAEKAFLSSTPTSLTEPVGDKREGFGGALTATIFGSIAAFIAMIAFGLMEQEEGISFILTFVVIALSIPALILGIKGMKCFFRAKNAGRIKPIATLVCGIIGLAMSVTALLSAEIIFTLTLGLFY